MKFLKQGTYARWEQNEVHRTGALNENRRRKHGCDEDEEGERKEGRR